MPLNYGIKVSKAGFDVFTATGNQLIFKSDSQLIKVAFFGTIALTALWTTVAHNLGYIPQFLVFINDSSDSKTYLGAASYYAGVARATTANIYIKRKNAANDTAYYYIFYEQA